MTAITHTAISSFHSARPVWPAGREREMNLFVGFRALLAAPDTGERVILRIAASTVYRTFVNGRFVGYGPARACHGHFRVDEWDITPYLRPGANVIAIEVAGYNVNSYAYLDQPSFLQAEALSAGHILASTAGEGVQFEAAVLAERIQKVQRYSLQRAFVEVYQLAPDCALWREDPGAPFEAVACAVQPAGQLIARRVPYPRFDRRPALRHVSRETIEVGEPGDGSWGHEASDYLKGYPQAELTRNIVAELRGLSVAAREPIGRPLAADAMLDLPAGSSHTFDFGINLTGFIGATVECREPARVYFIFDEILSDNDVAWERLNCLNAVTYDLQPGKYHLESFELYTLRYLQVIAVTGHCTISDVALRQYANPDVWEAHFAASDERMNRVFAAGRETFAQNAVDIFMDCPSRERAGWLCDSFFTARAAVSLNGNTAIETAFLENFLLPDHFANLPAGMLPMCYPADHNNGTFIPNWALWFVVQLEEYVNRGGDRQLVEALRPRVMALLDYFSQFHNEDGLLENLEKWVFIEWSAANDFVQDVNYPTNMLYAGALSAAGRLYNIPALLDQAEAIRTTVRQQSFDGEFFVDNAVREHGKLTVTDNRTEVCQYFAFFFDVASPRSHPELWRKLVNEFGPHRPATGAYADVHPANAFVGNMLRLEVLSRYGRCRQILDESIAYLLYMADRTGTLWENVDERASCNHGFASHICHTLYRDILGLYRVNHADKRLQIRFTDLGLDWCEGYIPVGDGGIELVWWREDNTVHYRLSYPAGWEVSVTNPDNLVLVCDR